MHDIELKQISVFIAVRELGGLTAAQERLGMSCSAISKSLADLEVRIGCKLCHRGRSGFRITQEGERFYNAALKLQESLRSFKSDIGNIKNAKIQVIRIGVVDGTLNDANNPLPGILKQLQQLQQQQHKNLEFKIYVSSSIDIADKLLANKLDLGLTYQQGLREPLKAIELYREELLFVMSNAHPHKQALQFFEVNNRHRSIDIKGEGFYSTLIIGVNQYGLVSFIHEQESAELFGAIGLKQRINNEWINKELMKKEPIELESVNYKHAEYEQVSNVEEILWRVCTSTNIGLVPRHLISNKLNESLYCFHADSDCYSPMYAVYRNESTHQEKERDEVFDSLLTLLAVHEH